MLAFVVGVWLADQAPPQTARIAASVDGGTATYGVQRTTHSQKPLWRDDGCITLEYDSTTISVAAGQAIDDAFAAWSDATVGASCGRVTVTGIRTPNPPSSQDGRNTVHILHDRWCHPASIAEPEICYDHSASAVTRVLFVDDPSDPDDGKILEIDMDLNAVDYELLAPGDIATTTKPALDLQAVATHEAGHALGLAHDCGTGLEPWPTDRDGTAVPECADASPAVRAATMFYVVAPNDTSARTVEASDVTGACAVVAGLSCEADVDGGCSTNGGGGWLGCVSVLFALSLRGRRARYHPCVEVPQRIQRFEVLEHIGSGGMGTVVRARDPQLERDVAIKLLSNPTRDSVASLSPDDTLDLRGEAPHSADELLREARMMARLSHPNVLPVYEVGLANDAVFLVMEHIAGTDLATWLADRRSTDDICTAFAQAGRGLAAAHAQNIIHRDFKPSNVLVGSDGRIRVADFGLSRLTLPDAMVRIDDGRGTPRYMAPELWRGIQASAPSDVFAFCISLGEALHERTIAPRLKALIVRGGADDPGQRPAMTELVAALENRHRRLPWIAAFGAAGAVGVIAAVLIFTGSSGPACGDLDLTGQWDPALRAALERQYLGNPPPAIDRAIGMLDRHRDAIAKAWHASCVAEGKRELTPADGLRQRSCLDRRRFELAALVSRARTAPLDLTRLGRVGGELVEAPLCATLSAPPLPKDPRAAAALHARYIASFELSKESSAKAHIVELLEIEKAADASGEQELAARAAFELGKSQSVEDQLDDADHALQRAYRSAQEMHSVALEGDVLIRRAWVAEVRGDSAAAASYATLAKDLVDKPETPVLVRAHIFGALGRAASSRGDEKLAIEHLLHALELVKSEPVTGGLDELQIRFDLTNTMVSLGDRPAAAIANALETVDRAKQIAGEHDANYGVALNMLAMAYNGNNDGVHAIQYRKRALANMIETLPPDNSHVAFQHADLAADLWRAADYNGAVAELQLALHGLEHNEMGGGARAGIMTQYASALFSVGRHDEALKEAKDALELALEKGGDTRAAINARVTVVEFELDMGKFDDGERDITLLENLYKAHPESSEARAIYLNAYRANIALRRNKPVEAEKWARAAIQTTTEVKTASDDQRSEYYKLLGEALLTEKKWAEARAALDTSLELARRINMPPRGIVPLEVAIAEVDAGEGHKKEALERVKQALVVLDAPGSDELLRGEAEELLKRLQKPR